LAAEVFHVDARHLVRHALRIDDMHAERLVLRPKTQHTGRQAQRTLLVEEVQVAGKLGGDRIEVEIPH